jgi:hypothetical protein
MSCPEQLSRRQQFIVFLTWIVNQGYSGLEDFHMFSIDRYVNSLVLAAALVLPAAALAGAAPQEASVQIRVYDRDHHDYHKWDAREDHAYRSYLSEQHREYRSCNKRNHKQQNQYWQWRHDHPDHN